MPGDGKNPDQWTPENQLAVIIETAALNEAEMAEYCRKKGLFAEQIQQWKAAFISGVSAKPVASSEQRKALTVEQKKDKQTIKKLEHELRRKDKALAETAALLVLTKKAREIWVIDLSPRSPKRNQPDQTGSEGWCSPVESLRSPWPFRKNRTTLVTGGCCAGR